MIFYFILEIQQQYVIQVPQITKYNKSYSKRCTNSHNIYAVVYTQNIYILYINLYYILENIQVFFQCIQVGIIYENRIFLSSEIYYGYMSFRNLLPWRKTNF